MFVVILLAGCVVPTPSDSFGGPVPRDSYSSDRSRPPALAWSVSEGEDRMTVVQAASDVPWRDLRIRGEVPHGTLSVALAVNADAEMSGSILDSRYASVPFGGDITAGDFLAFCGLSSDAPNVTVTLVHMPSNSVVQQYTFLRIHPCAGEMAVAPRITWTVNEERKEWIVEYAAGDARWSDLALKADQKTRFDLNTAANGWSPAVVGEFQDFPWPDTVWAGDYLSFCGSGSYLENVRVSLMHVKTNTLLFDYHFAVLPACPQDEVPLVAWSGSEATDRLIVTQAPQGLRWSLYQVRAEPGISFGLNRAGFWQLSRGYERVPSNQTMLAGDYLEFCSEWGGHDDVFLQVRHEYTMTVVHEAVFGHVESC